MKAAANIEAAAVVELFIDGTFTAELRRRNQRAGKLRCRGRVRQLISFRYEEPFASTKSMNTLSPDGSEALEQAREPIMAEFQG